MFTHVSACIIAKLPKQPSASGTSAEFVTSLPRLIAHRPSRPRPDGNLTHKINNTFPRRTQVAKDQAVRKARNPTPAASHIISNIKYVVNRQ
jgi:hypothetical protein